MHTLIPGLTVTYGQLLLNMFFLGGIPVMIVGMFLVIRHSPRNWEDVKNPGQILGVLGMGTALGWMLAFPMYRLLLGFQ